MNALFTLLIEKLKAILQKLKKLFKERKYRRLAVALCLLFFYLAGIIAQFNNNRYQWSPGKELYLPSLNPLKGLAMLSTPFGAQAIAGLFFFTVIGVLLYFLFKEDKTGMKYDKKRNFWYSEKGVYGTAGWMSDEDIQKNFDLTPEADAGTVKEVIYGIKDGMVISRKADSMLSEHTAILGSSGSMKSRAFASPNVQGNVIIGLGSRLGVLQNDEIAELMCYPDMDMLSLGKEKTAYFLVLSDQDTTMRFVSATFFSLLFLRLVQYADSLPERRLPVPVNLVLDELCSVVGAINGFHIKMSNVRSRAIHISFFFQALGQLQNRYPENMWSEVLSGADTTLIMGCNDPISAEYVSERSGDVTIYADTIMKSKNVFLPDILQPNFRHSEGTGRRKLLTADEVLRLEPKNMLLMLRGQQVLEIQKFDYTRNPESRKFRPVPIKGLKEVRQYPKEPISPSHGDDSEITGAAPNHNSAPKEVHAPHPTAKSHGREVVRDVTENSPQGLDADYAGPTVKKIGNPNI